MKFLILTFLLSQMTFAHASADSLSSLVGQWLIQKDGITDSAFTLKRELIFKNGEVLE